MSILKTEVRPGVYLDSIVLMQLQAALAARPGVEDAGVVMATASNLAVLEASRLLRKGLQANAEDLVIAVRTETESVAVAALAEVDELLTRRRGIGGEEEYRPRSLVQALRQLPEARWVLVSVPGRWAAGVADQALDQGRNVFLYSDNVSLTQERELKRKARSKGLLVLGPDCGTAHLAGVGLGFANRVRKGQVGVVAASGTGLQAIASQVHELGHGISQGIGTGGRDLTAEVGGITALQALDLLRRDEETRVIVLVSKPPDASVASRLLAAAVATEKPVVIYFLGQAIPIRRLGALHFAISLEEAADLAVNLLEEPPIASSDPALSRSSDDGRRWLRGLFSGGTLALEAALGLRLFLEPLFSNLKLDGVRTLKDPAHSQGHAILDLGSDEYTFGRLHPMIDPDLRLRRLRQEAADPRVALVLLDLVLGEGSHADPAQQLAPAIEEVLQPGEVEVLVLLVGTQEDPQGFEDQRERLENAGAKVFRGLSEVLAYAARRLGAPREASAEPPVALQSLASPMAVVNVGLESFHESLVAQGAACVQMDWRPPAGGDERLLTLLKKLS